MTVQEPGSAMVSPPVDRGRGIVGVALEIGGEFEHSLPAQLLTTDRRTELTGQCDGTDVRGGGGTEATRMRYPVDTFRLRRSPNPTGASGYSAASTSSSTRMMRWDRSVGSVSAFSPVTFTQVLGSTGSSWTVRVSVSKIPSARPRAS